LDDKILLIANGKTLHAATGERSYIISRITKKWLKQVLRGGSKSSRLCWGCAVV